MAYILKLTEMDNAPCCYFVKQDTWTVFVGEAHQFNTIRAAATEIERQWITADETEEEIWCDIVIEKL